MKPKPFRLALVRLVVLVGAAAAPCIALSTLMTGHARAEESAAAPVHDGAHDFDWDFGTWKMHISRLSHPLTGSTTWTEMDGTTVTEPIWGGRANVALVEADGVQGHLELLALRTYDAVHHQWHVSFATQPVGVISVPMAGEFTHGRGEFYDQEEYNGRTILVRFTIRAVTPDSARSEQSFSDDGGRTWEVNWINTYTRVKGAGAHAQK